MKRNRLDIKDKMPSGMEEYLSMYGWHFSKKLCEWAISNMRRSNSKGEQEKIPYTSKEDLQKLFQSYNIKIENNIAYDMVFVYHMAKADFFKSSILDEQHLLQYVKDYLDDVDGYDGLPMTRFYADCIGSGNPIIWEDVI